MARSWTSSASWRSRLGGCVSALVVLAVSGGCTPNASAPVSNASPTRGATPTRSIRYMPLGDSITDGFGIPGGYRTVLWQQLVETDHDHIDFVGSRSGGPPALGDREHQGLTGWCIAGTCRHDGQDTVLPQLYRWLVEYRPDIISIHLGTNDLATGSSGATTAKRLDQLVGRIYADRPDTYVVLIQTIPMGIEQAQHDAYDARIPGIAERYRAQGRRIAVADLSQTLTLPADYRDALHPTQQGYDKMGRALAPSIQAAYTSVS